MDPECIEIDPEKNSSKNVDMQSDEVQSVDMEGGAKRKRKDRSAVWNFFEKDKNAIKGAKKVQCKCNKCKAIFLYDSCQGTGNLLRHKERCYGKDFHDVGQMLFNSDMALRSSRFNQKTFRDLLVAAIVRHELPLSFVDYKGVRDLLTYLQPDANVITRNTVKSDLSKLFKNEKEKIRTMLMESPGMLCLTSDLWSSITTDGYLAITVHFIDKDWVLQKRILSFSFMPPPHSGIALSAKVFSILEEWGIEKKIFCVTLDNASSNDRFVDLLREQLDTKSPLISSGEFFHMRCCAHILNLIVQEGLKEIDQAVCKVRESVKYVKGSHSHVFMAYLTLHDSMSLGDEYMKDMATSMMAKFQKYWYDFNLTLAIAVVFDPRYKLHFIEWSYKKVYGESNYQFRKVDELLNSTFQEYVNVDNGSSTTSNFASSSNASKVVEKPSDDTRRFYEVRSKLMDFDDFESTEFVTNKKSELELYLEEPRMERTMELDVLAFWRANQFRYPILARMARDFLTIPVSTVASESTFSASGRVLDQQRSSLSKDSVEALICTKDWLYADSNEIDLDQLTEDVMLLDVSVESDASNSVNVSDPLKV